jgi:conjugative transfer signal peptidase TraF
MTKMITGKQLPLVVALVLSLFLVGWLFELNSQSKYYLNLTRSEPLGIYQLAPCNVRQLRVGDLVIMDVPRQTRQYVYGRRWLRRGWPLLKNVGAVAGDEYQVTATAIAVNDAYIGPVFMADSQGRALPRLRGRFQVKAGQFLPLSTHIRQSFDGRYFGAVPCSLIRGKALPVVTF